MCSFAGTASGRSTRISRRPTPTSTDEFGTGVALSADGTMLAAASSGEDGGSKGAAGDQSDNSVRDSGALYVY